MRTAAFNLKKFRVSAQAVVAYAMEVGAEFIDLNAYIGHDVIFSFTGVIHCLACGRKTKKSFNQGHCFPCFKRLASCDRCIVSPERCHFHEGTCREPAWAETHCFRPHVVYLANASGLKVGITRQSQVPTRWIDQGAVQALPVVQVPSRYASGLVEVAFKRHVGDRTNWRRMLTGRPEPVDLGAARERLLGLCRDHIAAVRGAQPLTGAEEHRFEYPVSAYPQKVCSLNPERTPVIEGSLIGLKGQYVILDTGVFNARRFGGYQLTFAAA